LPLEGNADKKKSKVLNVVVLGELSHGTCLEFIISQGDFIYKQLIGLDTMLKANDKGFEDIPALIALRDESKKQAHFANTQVRPSNATLRMLHLRPH
jgi:hypothetical protein